MALTYEDAITALRNADAAGDTEAAQRLAGIADKLRSARAAPAEAPTGPVTRGIAEIPTEPPPGVPRDVAPAAVQPMPAPAAQPEEGGVAGFLKGAVQRGIGGLETGRTLATGATSGMAAGILSTVNNAVKRALTAVTGGDTGELPTTEQAFTQGMEAGTYKPQTEAGQQQAGAVGQFLQEQGPSVMGIGPELATLGKTMGAARPFVRPAAATALEKAVPSIPVERARNVQAGMEQGIVPAPHQLAENKFVKLAGEAAETTPGAFGGMRRAERQSAFNRALVKQINPEADSPKLTPEVFGEAMDRSGGKIGELSAKTDVPLTDVQAGFEAQRRRPGSEANRELVNSYIGEFERLANENGGSIPGTAFKELNSELGKEIRSNAGSTVGERLSDLQDVMLDAFRDKLSPEDRALYDVSRREYAKAKTILPLVAKSLEGDISPGALMGAINATKAGKNAMAKGYAGEMGDLAKAGRYLVDQKSSGTAERGLIYKLILDPLKEAAKAAAIYPAATGYNLAGPAVTRAMVRKSLRGAAPAGEPPVGGPPVAPEPPPGGAGPTGGPPAPVDPRLAEVQKLREGATSEAVRAALDEHEKTVRKTLQTEAAARQRAADVQDLETAARATQDPELRKTLQAKADKLRDEKIPVGEAKELAAVPTPKPEKAGKIPVGKVVEGQPELSAPKTEPIPAGEATEIVPEEIAPPEPIPAGEAAPLPSNVPAAEVVSNVPQAEPVSNMPAVERGAAPVSNIPQSEASAYQHQALFDDAARRGIEIRGRRPGEVRAAVESAWAAEHKLNPFEVTRAKAVAKALDIDEKAVEAAARQHENSPRAFDRAIDKILKEVNAPETEQAPGGSESTTAKPEATPERATGATETGGERPGANRPAATGAEREGNQPAGSSQAGVEIREAPTGFEAFKDGKKVGYLKSNLTPEQSKQLKESASVDMVKVDKDVQGSGVGRSLYAAWEKAHGGRIEPSGKTEPAAWKLWKRNYPEKVDAFVAQEAKRIRDGADPQVVIGNIKDPEIAQRVQIEAKQSPTEKTPVASATPAPRGFEKGAQKVNKLNLWRKDPTSGLWRVARDVTPETADQYLEIFREDDPKAEFKVSATKPPSGATAPGRKKGT